MKLPLYGGALLMGGLIGFLALQASKTLSNDSTELQEGSARAKTKSAGKPESTPARIRRLISNESPAMDENVPMDEATDLLFSEEKSPMRTRSFLKNRIHLMTWDQLNSSLMNGEIQSDAEVREAARKLTTDNPDGTFQTMQIDRAYRLHGMDNLYAFLDTMLEVGARTDGLAMMKRLQTMTRGGSQQDSSLRFSGKWAKFDPAAAAENFDDLVYLRNLSDKGKMIFTDNAYAGQIVNSWQKKDEKGLRDYVKNLPAGRKQQAFQSALKKLK